MGGIYGLEPGTTKTVTRTTITRTNGKKKKKKKGIGATRKQFFGGGGKPTRGGLTGLFRKEGFL